MTTIGQPAWERLFHAVGSDPLDESAWSELFRVLWPYMIDFIVSRYGLDGAQAADVLQEATLRYRKKLLADQNTVTSLNHFRAFVRYRVLDALRARSRLVALDDIAPPRSSDNPEREIYQKLLVDEALNRMDQRCGYMLRAKYFHGRSSSEIASTMGLEEGHVRVLLHRCRERCRQLFQQLLPEASVLPDR